MRTRDLLIALAACAMGAAGAEPGFVPIFDGKTLDGWELFAKQGPGYVAENGMLVCPQGGGGNLLTRKDYANFVLRFEFRMTPGGNNGVGIRAPLAGDIAYSGIEIQILDDEHEKYRGRLKPAQLHGSIYDGFPAKPGHLKPAGQWNQQEITAHGRRIQVKLNGVVILDANLDDVTDPAVRNKHPGLARASGRIGLLGHGTRVEFRNLRVKELPAQ